MVNGVTEDCIDMTQRFQDEAMVTESIEENRVNGEKKMFTYDLRDEIMEEKSQIPAANANGEGLHVGEMKGNKTFQKMSGDYRTVAKSVKSALEIFESDLQQKQQKHALYEEKRRKIISQVAIRTKNVLFIDTRCSKTKPEYVDSVLFQLDNKVLLKHQWRRHQRYPSLWEGAVAAFENPQRARRVRKLLKDSKHLTAVPIHEIFGVLVEAEVRHPDSNETSTVLVIRAKDPLPQKMEQSISAQFKRFRLVTRIEFQPNINPGEVYRVWFKYASHAFYAKLISEQTTVINLGIVSAEVIMTRKETRIFECMKNHLRHK